MSRTDNSIRNVRFSVFYKTLAMLLNLAARKVFVLALSTEYLGLNGVFSNILSMLSIAELGVGTAITFSMYKPLAENDQPLVVSLLALYRRLYVVIGMVVLLLGAALTPFLPVLIKDIPSIPNINLIYLMFVVSSSISYFFAYKQSLIIANQKQYIVTQYSYRVALIFTIGQMVALLLTRNYILYLCLTIGREIVTYWGLARKANKMYGYIVRPHIDPLPQQVKEDITRNIKAMLMHRVGDVLVFSTDNIILAYFVGAIPVGLYSNYTMITSSVQSMTSMLFNSVTASVGNLNASQDKKHVLDVFNKIEFFTIWCFGFVSICIFILINPFIHLWLGEEYLFPINIVFLIVLNFFLTGMRRGVLLFREAMGLYWYDRYKPVAAAAVNLIVSIVLAKPLGIVGVFIGTAVSTLTTSFWIEPYVLYKYGFGTPVKQYFKKYLTGTMVTVTAAVLTWRICAYLPAFGLVSILSKAVVCCLIPNIVFFFAYGRTEEFRYFKFLLIQSVSNIAKR